MIAIGNAMHEWETGYDWLMYHLEGMSANELRSIVLDFAAQEGEDGIQEMFQTDMDADGFFQTKQECSVCSDSFEDGEEMYSAEGIYPLHKRCAQEMEEEMDEEIDDEDTTVQ